MTNKQQMATPQPINNRHKQTPPPAIAMMIGVVSQLGAESGGVPTMTFGKHFSIPSVPARHSSPAGQLAETQGIVYIENKRTNRILQINDNLLDKQTSLQTAHIVAVVDKQDRRFDNATPCFARTRRLVDTQAAVCSQLQHNRTRQALLSALQCSVVVL